MERQAFHRESDHDSVQSSHRSSLLNELTKQRTGDFALIYSQSEVHFFASKLQTFVTTMHTTRQLTGGAQVPRME